MSKEGSEPSEWSGKKNDLRVRDSILLDGLMRVEEFQEATGVRLDDESHEGVETRTASATRRLRCA